MVTLLHISDYGPHLVQLYTHSGNVTCQVYNNTRRHGMFVSNRRAVISCDRKLYAHNYTSEVLVNIKTKNVIKRLVLFRYWEPIVSACPSHKSNSKTNSSANPPISFWMMAYNSFQYILDLFDYLFAWNTVSFYMFLFSSEVPFGKGLFWFY